MEMHVVSTSAVFILFVGFVSHYMRFGWHINEPVLQWSSGQQRWAWPFMLAFFSITITVGGSMLDANHDRRNFCCRWLSRREQKSRVQYSEANILRVRRYMFELLSELFLMYCAKSRISKQCAPAYHANNNSLERANMMLARIFDNKSDSSSLM